MRKLLIVTAILWMVPGMASAGGGGGSISPCAGFGAGSFIVMLDSCFEGTAHFVPTDNTIAVSNGGELPHTFTAVDGSFDSGQVLPGDTFEFTIDKPGIYEVFCTLHGTASGQGMAGVLVVGEAEPLPVSAQIDTSAISAAVAAETESLGESLNAQMVAIGNLSAAQASLRGSIEEMSSVEPSAVPADSSVNQTESVPWVALVAGLGAGVALALLANQRPRRHEQSLSGRVSKTA